MEYVKRRLIKKDEFFVQIYNHGGGRGFSRAFYVVRRISAASIFNDEVKVLSSCMRILFILGIIYKYL